MLRVATPRLAPHRPSCTSSLRDAHLAGARLPTARSFSRPFLLNGRSFATEKASKIPTLEEVQKAIEEGKSGYEVTTNLRSDPDMVALRQRLEAASDKTIDLSDLMAELKAPPIRPGQALISPRLWYELFKLAEELKSHTFTFVVFNYWRRYEKAVLLIRRALPDIFRGEQYLSELIASGDPARAEELKFPEGLLADVVGILFSPDERPQRDHPLFKQAEKRLNDQSIFHFWMAQTHAFCEELQGLAKDREDEIEQLQKLRATVEDEQSRIQEMAIAEVVEKHPEWLASTEWAQREHKWYEYTLPPEEETPEEDEHATHH